MAELEKDPPAKRPSPATGAGPGPAPADRDASASRPDASAAGRAPATPAAPAAPPSTPLTQQVGRVVLVALAVLFGVFAVFNFQYVDFSWVFGDTTVVKDNAGDRLRGGVPLIVLLVASFITGAVMAWISTLRSERRKRKGDG